MKMPIKTPDYKVGDKIYYVSGIGSKPNGGTVREVSIYIKRTTSGNIVQSEKYRTLSHEDIVKEDIFSNKRSFIRHYTKLRQKQAREEITAGLNNLAGT